MVNLDSKVLCKIDWFQAVFVNVSFDYVLNDFLELDLPDFDDVFNSMFERPLGYDSHIAFSYNGIMISTRSENLLSLDERSMFLSDFNSIQLQVSGSGLDYLRSLGKDIDSLCRKPIEYHDNGVPIWHVTRCDFAYDFVNYHIDIYQEAKDFLDTEYAGKSSVFIPGSLRPTKFSIRSGGERTIYVGANRSDKLLRIYDKYLEQTDRSGLLKSTPCDGDIRTWVRIEFQCRNKVAHNMLYGSVSYFDVLYFVYDNYSFLTQDHKRADFWQNMFDWESIRSVIQNANYTKPKTSKDSIEHSIRRSLPNIVASLMSDGGLFFGKALYEYLRSILDSSQYGSFRSRSLGMKIQALNEYNVDFRLLPGADLISFDGIQSLVLKPGIIPAFDNIHSIIEGKGVI